MTACLSRLFTSPLRRLAPRQLWGPKLPRLLVLMACSLPSFAAAQSVAWIKQLGTAGNEQFEGLTAGASGNVFAVGLTQGSIFAPNAGSSDALMAKYSSSGNLLGGLQDGTAAGDEFRSATVDNAGGIYVAGNTQGGGSLGPPSVGTGDIVLGRINAANSYVWLRQDNDEFAFAAGGEPTGNFFTTGNAFSAIAGPHLGGGDVLMHLYDSNGALLWDDQTGTSADEGANAAVADLFGNYYVAGRTAGNWGAANAGGADVFVAKYDSAGVQQWVAQLGSTGTDAATSVTVDFQGDVYVAGITDGDMGGPNQGSFDNFVIKYDSGGNFQWVKQIATAGLETNPSVTAFGLSVWVTGSTSGSMFGPNLGQWDVYATQLNVAGNTMWSTQIGTSGFDSAVTSATGIGAVYVAGTTNGSFGGPNQGGDDAFVLAINAIPPIPEPSSLCLLAVGAVAVGQAGRRGMSATLLRSTDHCCATVPASR
jgi:large repetitive protein